MANILIGDQFRLEKPMPNLDVRYGVYSSRQEAFETLNECDSLALGCTVGILENGSVVEYWFKSACNSASDLVKKMDPTPDIQNLVAGIDFEQREDCVEIRLLDKYDHILSSNEIFEASSDCAGVMSVQDKQKLDNTACIFNLTPYKSENIDDFKGDALPGSDDYTFLSFVHQTVPVHGISTDDKEGCTLAWWMYAYVKEQIKAWKIGVVPYRDDYNVLHKKMIFLDAFTTNICSKPDNITETDWNKINIFYTEINERLSNLERTVAELVNLLKDKKYYYD